METTVLKEKLKAQIIEHLNLTELKPEDIKDEEELFGGGLGLDSIDSLELIVLLNREYGITIKIQKKAAGFWWILIQWLNIFKRTGQNKAILPV